MLWRVALSRKVQEADGTDLALHVTSCHGGVLKCDTVSHDLVTSCVTSFVIFSLFLLFEYSMGTYINNISFYRNFLFL